MRKSGIYRNICSVIIIFMLGLFLFLLRYDVPLGGDDIGGLVSNNPDNTYIDDRIMEGECELNLDYSLRTSWNKLVESYFSWTGRVITKFLTPLIRMFFSFPEGINWIIFSLYIMSMLLIMFLLVVDIVSGSFREGMRSPMVVLLVGALIFFVPSYSYAYMTRLIMYTFTDIYVASVVLYLAYYRLLQRVFKCAGNISAGSIPVEGREGTMPSCRALIGINLTGFLAGLSHEAYGVIFGTVFLVQLGRFWLENHRKISIRYFLMYIGYIIGFCICFFAPGNFNRAGQSHESALRTVPLTTRLANSFYIHAFVAYKVWVVPVIVLPVLIVVTLILLKKKIFTIKNIWTALKNNLEWFFGFMMSAVTWGLVTRVVNYGLLAANIMLIIGIIRVLHEAGEPVTERIRKSGKVLETVQKAFAGCSIVIVILLTAANYSDVLSAHRTADIWREKLCAAREINADEIAVPAYATDLNPRFYEVSSFNDQDRFDKVAYCVVYGTHVVIDSSYNGE